MTRELTNHDKKTYPQPLGCHSTFVAQDLLTCLRNGANNYASKNTSTAKTPQSAVEGTAHDNSEVLDTMGQL